MLTRERAKKAIELIINKPDPHWQDKPKLAVVEDHTLEREWGWVFFYNSINYLESGNLTDALVGNAPYIVNKTTGEILATGTAYEIEYYIEEYESRLQTEL